MSTHIVLVGFMGAGKTSVGQQLAARLGRSFIDVDQWIESNASRSILDIFAHEGEAGFRALESDAVQQAVAAAPAVIAVGGGALQNRANVRALRRRGELIWLRAPLTDMIARATKQGGRPLLEDPATAAALYAAREPLYSLADMTVDVGGLNLEEAVQAVLARWQHRAQRGAGRADNEPSTPPEQATYETVPVQIGEGTYDVHVGAGLLVQGGELCAAADLPETGLLVTNATVGDLYAGQMLRALSKAGRRVPRMDIPDGEEHKTLATANLIYEAALNYKLGRDTAFYALGGGVVGDVTGFAAATYLRGVPFVQVPTTLLAQVDASVGGKTGVNLSQGKNLVGAFYQPRVVVADVDTLLTLPARELAAGLAEVVKYGAIGDEPFLTYLEDRHHRLVGLDRSALTKVVARSVQNKAAVVAQDERETSGVRELLNFGHTVGHALEAATGYTRWSHGEAVAIGMVTAALLSRRAAGLADDEVARLIKLLRVYGLPVSPGAIDVDEVKRALQRDKKVRKGRQRFVLLRSLGSAFVSDEVADEWVHEALQEQQTL